MTIKWSGTSVIHARRTGMEVCAALGLDHEAVCLLEIDLGQRPPVVTVGTRRGDFGGSVEKGAYALTPGETPAGAYHVAVGVCKALGLDASETHGLVLRFGSEEEGRGVCAAFPTYVVTNYMATGEGAALADFLRTCRLS